MIRPLAIDLFCGLGGWSDGLLAEGWDVIGFDIEQHVYGEHRYPAKLVVQNVLTLHGSQFKTADLIVASPPCQEYSYMAMPVENVRGAQEWVGRARWNFGSFYLWGDVPALMPMTFRSQKFNPDGTAHGPGSWFAIADSKNRGARAIKNNGGSWFNIAHNTTSGKGQNPDGRKGVPHRTAGHWTNPAEHEGMKHRGSGEVWFDTGPASLPSKSPARKMASAMIAKIPLPLARHIACVFKPAKAEAA